MKVLGNAVLILPDRMPEKTSKGLLIPETVKDTTEMGKVIDCGSACTRIKKGDKIHFPRKSCSVMEIDGVLHFFTNEYKIFYNEQRK